MTAHGENPQVAQEGVGKGSQEPAAASQALSGAGTATGPTEAQVRLRLALDLATVRAERDQLRQTVRDLEAQMPARDARVAAEAKRIAGRAVLAYWGGDVTRDDQAGTWMQAVHGGDTDDPEDWEEAYREADGLGAP